MANAEEVNRYKLVAVVDSSRTISNNEVSTLYSFVILPFFGSFFVVKDEKFEFLAPKLL